MQPCSISRTPSRFLSLCNFPIEAALHCIGWIFYPATQLGMRLQVFEINAGFLFSDGLVGLDSPTSRNLKGCSSKATQRVLHHYVLPITFSWKVVYIVFCILCKMVSLRTHQKFVLKILCITILQLQPMCGLERIKNSIANVTNNCPFEATNSSCRSLMCIV